MNAAMTRYGHTNNKIHPLKFGLWIGLGSITMMFGALTSAYMVRRAAGNWLEFTLPNLFFVSTVVLLISSLMLHMSYNNFKAENRVMYRSYLTIAFVLGIAFMILQYMGWNKLYSLGIDLRGNPAGSFLYMITGVHALHILGGLVALLIAMINSVMLPFKVTTKRILNFELTLQYWHFVDLLWVYLLVFLYLSR